MKILEHRRHSMRHKPGAHLNQAGIDRAKEVGYTLLQTNRQFARVVTSTLPRAIETAIAMGFAVDDTIEELSTTGADVDQELKENGLGYANSFVEYQKIMSPNSFLSKFADNQLQLYRRLLQEIKSGEALLIISHGGVVEFPLLKMFEEKQDLSKWGDLFDYCEGYRVYFEANTFKHLELLRI